MKTIKSKQDFHGVFSEGKHISRPTMRVIYMQTQSLEPRLAFCAPKRLGSAPLRNRCKRLLRQAVFQAPELLQHYDLILFATPRTPHHKSYELSLDFQSILHDINTRSCNMS